MSHADPSTLHLDEALAAWDLDTAEVGVEPLGTGHIHGSLRLTIEAGDAPGCFVLQRLNDHVLPDAAGVMANLERILDHLARRARQRGDEVARSVPQLVATSRGESWFTDSTGCAWRLFREIADTVTLLEPDSARRARAAAWAFGRFQADLAELPAAELVEVLPDFHHTPQRYTALDRARTSDAKKRAERASAELDFAERHRPTAGLLVDLLERGELPLRVVHNDAKIANVLFDRASGEALCAIDYDTVMPGLTLYDFGDLVRSMATRASEDETDLAQVVLDRELLAAVTDGYLEGARDLLTGGERRHLFDGARVIVLEQGVRFLTDYLDGDRYYNVTRPDHNLERCRVQFTLFEALCSIDVAR